MSLATRSRQLAKVALIVLLLDGVLDISVFLVRAAADGLRRRPAATAGPAACNRIPASETPFLKVYHPGVGPLPPLALQPVPSVVDDTHSTRGILLGASQAGLDAACFRGLTEEGDKPLAGALDDLLPTSRVDDYAVVGQRIDQGILYLQSLLDRSVPMDYVLMVSGPVEAIYQCMSGPQEYSRLFGSPDKRQPALLAASSRISAWWSSYGTQKTSYCGDNVRDVRNVVNRLLFDIRNAQALAARLHVRFAFVLPPTPYGSRANVSNLEGNPQFLAWQRELSPVFIALRERLRQEQIPGVIDLSDAFDNEPAYFVDAGAHLTGSGLRALARAIMASLGQEFFSTSAGGEFGSIAH